MVEMKYVGKCNRNFIKWLKEALSTLGLLDSYDRIIDIVKNKDKGIIMLNSALQEPKYIRIFWNTIRNIKKVYGDISRDRLKSPIIRTILDQNEELSLLWLIDRDEYRRIVFSELIDNGIEFPKDAFNMIKFSRKMKLAIVNNPDGHYLCTPIGYIRLNKLGIPGFYVNSFNKILREIGVDFNIDSSTTWDKIEPYIIKYLLKSVWK